VFYAKCAEVKWEGIKETACAVLGKGPAWLVSFVHALPYREELEYSYLNQIINYLAVQV
jgi:hypothetical protein